ncbi:F-box protein SKIP23-like [Macadamia integrifolia]|uniref:F-box protein SKIP23-like n=1 Tax=Macadamia integrifolia TaxID=60698 RepID=UPI001C4ED7C3|nr:F-box protein SKIP23-like [Macadamia integrifolia]
METPNLTTQPKADWSKLPNDLFNIILERLRPIDHIRVSCVCSPWRSMTPKLHFWLMLPCNYFQNYFANYGTCYDDSRDDPFFLGLVNLADPDHELHLLRLAEASGRLVCGYTAGWLVTLRTHGDIHLLNPFTKAHLQLPRLTFESFPDIPKIDGFLRRVFVGKVIVGLSSDGSSSSSSSSFETDGVVMAMCLKPKKLAFFRLGKDQNWASFEGYSGPYKDIIFHNGRFYAIRNKCQVFVASGLDGPSPTLEAVMRIPCYTMDTKYYLVESSGDLLLVIRHPGWLQRCHNQTISFSIYKIDVGGRKLVKLKNIGNRCLFLDRNSAFSVSASDIRGCKGNHIYFIGTCFHGHTMQSFGTYDRGVFNLEDKTLETFNFCNVRGLFMYPPIWYPPYIHAGAVGCDSGCSSTS